MVFLCVLDASNTNPRNIDCSHLGRGDDITFTSDRGRSLRRTAFSLDLRNWNPNACRLATVTNQQRLLERDRSIVASASSVRISPKQFPMIKSIQLACNREKLVPLSSLRPRARIRRIAFVSSSYGFRIGFVSSSYIYMVDLSSVNCRGVMGDTSRDPPTRYDTCAHGLSPHASRIATCQPRAFWLKTFCLTLR